MDLYVVIDTKTNHIHGIYKSKEDAINALNKPIVISSLNDIGDFTIIKQSIDLKDIKDEDKEDFYSFICIEGYTTETLTNKYDGIYPKVEYSNITYNLEIDKDFKAGVPKFTKFDASATFAANDSLNIKTYFTIWIESKTVKSSSNLKGYIGEIIKIEYSKLDRIKDFKQAFDQMKKVRYYKTTVYPDDMCMWKERR